MPVRIVDIDDAEPRRVGQWPWPRPSRRLVDQLFGWARRCRLRRGLRRARSHFASAAARRADGSRGVGPSARREIERLPDHDAVLGRGVRARARRHGLRLRPARAVARRERPPASTTAAIRSRICRREQGTVVNLPELEAAASGNGSFTVDPDHDGVHRRVPLLSRTTARCIRRSRRRRSASRGREGVLDQDGRRERRASFGTNTGITQLRIGDFTVPTEAARRDLGLDTRRRSGSLRAGVAGAGRRGRPEAHRRQHRAGRHHRRRPARRRRHAARSCRVGRGRPRADHRADPAKDLGDRTGRPARSCSTCCCSASGLRAGRSRPARWAPRARRGRDRGRGRAVVVRLPWHWLFDPVYPPVTLARDLSGAARCRLHAHRARAAPRAPRLQLTTSRRRGRASSRHPEQLQLGGEMRDITVLFSDVRGFTTISERARCRRS